MQQLWHWLTSPTGLPVLIAIIGVLSGILGGVTAQMVAGFFKTRGDTRQLRAADKIAEAAAKRWDQEQAFARKQYLLEARRMAFVHFLNQADLIWVKWHRFSSAERSERKMIAAEVHSGIESLSAMVNELGLYDDSIAAKAGELMRSEPDIDTITRSNFNDKVKPWNALYRDLQAMMRKSIGIEQTHVNVPR